MKCRQFRFYADLGELPLLMAALEDHVIPRDGPPSLSRVDRCQGRRWSACGSNSRVVLG